MKLFRDAWLDLAAAVVLAVIILGGLVLFANGVPSSGRTAAIQRELDIVERIKRGQSGLTISPSAQSSTTATDVSSIAGLFGLALLVAVYFVPSLVGVTRQHHNLGSIVVLNLFLGWTVIGWVLALAMSASATQTKERARREPAIDGALIDESHAKVCPFCKADVAIDSQKCRHCGEWIVAADQRSSLG